MNFTAATQRARSARALPTFLAAALAALTPGQSRALEGNRSAGMAVTVVETQQTCFDDILRLTGFIVAREEALVRPDVDGYHVAKVLGEDGELVTAGRKLAELVKPEWLPRALPETADVTANAGGILIIARPIPIGMPVSSRAEPLFRIIRNGEFDLELDVPRDVLAKIKPGQNVRIETLESGDVSGTLRSVTRDVDALSQLGHARVQIVGKPSLRLGAFATAAIDVGQQCGTSVPLSAILFGPEGPVVQVVKDDHVEVRRVQTGLFSGGEMEIVSGLAPGELVVAKAGTFLRAQDPVRPLLIKAHETP